MATMSLYIGTGIYSVTVHASNDYYPKTFYGGGRRVSLTDLPSSGNAWINANSDVTFLANYGNPIAVTTENPSGSWTLGNDPYISIRDGRSITLTPTYSAPTSYTLTVSMPSVVNSITFSNGNTATKYNGSGRISYSSGVKVTSVSMSGTGLSWSGTLYWSNGTSTFAFATVTNGSVSVYGASSQEQIDCTGSRTITVTAVKSPTTYYYRYRYIVESTKTILETSSLYSATSSAGYITVKLSAIPEPSNTSYVKSGSYVYVAHCAINAEDNYARCTGTSTSDPSIIGVYVHPTTKAYYYKLRYLTPSGGKLSESSIYAKSAAYSSTSTPVTLSELPGPGRAGWEKTGSYTAVAHCSIVSAYDYATITSTSTSDPSIIGVYCKKTAIAPFYWDGDDGTGDAAIIATGLPVRNITAARWNRLKAKIAEVATAQGSSWSYSPVSSGDAITAGTASAPGEYRIVRSGISSLTGHGSLPALRSAGDRIIASDFRGAGSLQSALNAAITLQNNQ